ncbi:reverse transcriptase [Phytophthora megakarya]|uniref:Reverse transcriptase n=1 Tax=Phytophthora megakarya TaxID=4795 RepID=A0A225VEQ7_9STRA|nr:reverse transcriptase [Phytophthora megakarya]
MPSSGETNNTAEYTALLLGVQSASHHGATSLAIEGDSHLVVAQVRGAFACRNQRLRQLRNRVRHALRSVTKFTLQHVDRKANAHADRLANRALDMKRTLVECGRHHGSMDLCWHPSTTAPTQNEMAAPLLRFPAAASGHHSEVSLLHDDEEADIAARDNGEVFPTLPIGPGSAPARQPRLRLRLRTEDDHETAAVALQAMAEELACKIVDADSWTSGDGYISAIPGRIREVLRPYTTDPPQHQSSLQQQRQRPPRVTRNQREHRLDEAIDDLEVTQRERPDDRTSIHRARRRVGRIRGSMRLQQLRQRFGREERKCVEEILRTASPETAAEEHPDTCPIDATTLHEHFTAVNTPRINFLPDEACGEDFRRAMADIGQPTAERNALTDELTMDEVEDQLAQAAANSSPGHDGVGYDVYRKFAAQLVPLLHAAFQFCWSHRRVPALWKVGFVRLIHKKGNPKDPSNWRPICLQTAIYKLYSGLLARRLSAYLEGNALLPMAQKGFRAYNGCHEHNFVATTLLDQTRRMHRKLYQVWYDLRNAFGSVHQDMLWYVLRLLGVEHDFVARCHDIYDDSYFVVGNAVDGATEPVRQEVGVYQGCPLSPLLFIAALVPLLRALEKLDGVGVALADGVRPCATAYADDLKVFSDSAAGIKRCHAVVETFLEWTGLQANPGKCALLAVTRNARGNPPTTRTSTSSSTAKTSPA